MKASRLFLYGLAVLALALLAAGIYYYPRLPELVEQQARTYLSAYGISDVELGSLQVSTGRLATDRLRLIGDMDGLQFDVTVSGISVDYTPGELWRGHIRSVAVAGLEASAVEQSATPASDPSSLVLSDATPASLFADLPVAALEVSEWQLNYRPLQGSALVAQGALYWDGQLALPFDLMMSGVRVAGKLAADERNTLGLDAAFYADTDTQESSLGRLQATGAPGGMDRWHWQMAGEVDYLPLLDWLRNLQIEGASQALEHLALDGASVFNAELHHPDKIKLPADLGQEALAHFDGSFEARTTLAMVSYAGIVEEASGQFDLTTRVADGTLEATLGPLEMDAHIPAALLQLPEQTRQWLRWGDRLPLRWREPGTARLAQSGDGTWRLQMVDNRLLLGDKNSQVKLDGIALDVTLEAAQDLHAVVALDTTLDMRLRQKQLPQLKLALKQRGTIEGSDIELRLGDTAQSLALSLEGELNAETGQGAFVAGLRSLDLPYAGSTIVPLLQKFDLLQQSLAFSAGNVSLNSELRLGGFSLDQLAQKANLSVEGVSGSYGEYQFEGIDVSARWQGVEKWQTLQPATLSVARLDVGFAVTDTRVALVLPRPTALDSPVFRLDQFESRLFGGRVYLPEPARWDFSGDSNSVTLRADDWRLEDLVALQAGQDIRADGTLEGELPVTVSGGRIIIEKGYFRARAPGGRIRYVADAASQALAASSPELGLAMGLLEDFRYKTLSSEVELDPEGNLLLGLSLEGSNPAHYDGRTIRFNINLEQNLDPLLQSLRLSDSLVEKVEKGLR